MEHALQNRYDDLWRQAQSTLAAGAAELDPHLANKAQDRRRGATLLIRPSVGVAQAVAATLAELQTVEPQQYYYAAAELHVTVLSLFTGTEEPAPYLALLPRYQAAIAPVLAGTRAFPINFAGLTASAAAVLVQGFPHGAWLYELREALRGALHAAGLGDTLDRRYRIATAHMTAVRFCRPLRDPQGLVAAIVARRDLAFGSSEATEVQLVTNDWYMSQDQVSVLQRYPLAP
jgi:2'-5' RNA ligase